jgi:hypothetical protein
VADLIGEYSFDMVMYDLWVKWKDVKWVGIVVY